MSEDKAKKRIVLVTGASGYVGGRLVPVLEERGERVRCLARNPGYLAGRLSPDTQIVAGNVLDPDSLGIALGRGGHGLLHGPFHGFRGQLRGTGPYRGA